MNGARPLLGIHREFFGRRANHAPRSGPPPCPTMSATHQAHEWHEGRTASRGLVPALASKCARRNLRGVLVPSTMRTPEKCPAPHDLYIRILAVDPGVAGFASALELGVVAGVQTARPDGAARVCCAVWCRASRPWPARH